MLLEPTYLTTGKRYDMLMPHSEVCMHMRIAGQAMLVEITYGMFPMAQVYDQDGRKCGAPITLGEAGIYRNGDGRPYAYDAHEVLASSR